MSQKLLSIHIRDGQLIFGDWVQTQYNDSHNAMQGRSVRMFKAKHVTENICNCKMKTPQIQWFFAKFNVQHGRNKSVVHL